MPETALPRRRFLRLAALGGAAGALAVAGHAQPPPPTETGAEFITPETQAGIDRGLAFLARVQQDDGAFADRLHGAATVGVTALGGLALMAGGHQPGRGRYGRAVSRAVDYLLASARQSPVGALAGSGDGFAGRGNGQPALYSHGFGTLFLSEVCGMLPDPARQRQVRETLERATAFAVSAQNKDGGWRYEVNPAVADVSVTVAMMMALRAARNAGVFVRKNVIDRGVQYIKDCQRPNGGFTYFKGQGDAAFPRSAAAVVGLYSAGIYTGPEVRKGLDYLRQFLPGRGMAFRENLPQHYYYGQYYAALAMWTAGGERWAEWFPAVRDDLLLKMRAGPAGVWGDNTHGSAYATAMSLIVLQLPNNYLPILQK